MEDPNILITGLPRSGTTLTCELLGSLPDTVALDEPLDRNYLMGTSPQPRNGLARVLSRLGRSRVGINGPTEPVGPVSPDDVCRRVEQFVSGTRHSALTRGVVRTKSVNGEVIGRKVSDERDESGMRVRLVTIGEIEVHKPLTPDFVLAIKQCGGFTAVIDALVTRFPVYALIRNPLSILSSWQSVPMPIRDGHIPLAERLNPALARELDGILDPTDRQFYLLDWFFGTFARVLPRASIVSYEDIVASGGRALQALSPRAAQLEAQLGDRNRGRKAIDDAATVHRLAARLLDTDGPWWEFYTRDNVTDLVGQVT